MKRRRTTKKWRNEEMVGGEESREDGRNEDQTNEKEKREKKKGRGTD